MNTPDDERGGEIWKPVLGFDDYEVSNLGRVRSWRKTQRRARATKPHLLVGGLDSDGYRMVVLCTNDGKGRKTYKVCKLVAMCFMGPKPPGTEIAHENGDGDDNRVSNLSYKTPAQNNQDKWRHGTMPCGERQWNAKLTVEQVLRIRQTQGSSRIVAGEFGVCSSVIRAIRSRRSWRWL